MKSFGYGDLKTLVMINKYSRKTKKISTTVFLRTGNMTRETFRFTNQPQRAEIVCRFGFGFAMNGKLVKYALPSNEQSCS